MCDICVMDKVKDRMLSRRHLFTGGAALAAGAALSATLPEPAEAAGYGGKAVDMTHTIHPDFPTYFGTSHFSAEQIFNFDEHKVNLFNLTINEHTGTHIDAPLHFSADGASVDELPVNNLFAPLCVIDIADRAAGNPDTQVTPDDISAWMSAHGDIPRGACVAMHSGWARKVDTDGFRNFDGEAQHYPGFHIEATQMLLERTRAASIAVDTLSIDHGISGDFATHYAWLPAGRFGIECLSNLDRVPAAGATIVIGAPKFAGSTGGPARIFALV